MLEEAHWLTLPHAQSTLVDRGLQVVDVGLRLESSTEVTSRRWVRHAVHAEHVQERFVGAPLLEILDARPAGEQVVRHREDVIRLAVRTMQLQQVEASVEFLWKPQRLRQVVSESDASGSRGRDPTRRLESRTALMEISDVIHRLLESARDSALAPT
jgi:hypothetical protein